MRTRRRCCLAGLSGSQNANAQVIPLPVSGGGAGYATSNGYWETSGYPIITGCLKIELQTNANAWSDVTAQILSQGYIGRNINPTTWPNNTIPPSLPALTPAQGPTTNTFVTSQISCQDPSPNAIIRLARLRDNPSYQIGTNVCGNVAGGTTVLATDVWPLVLFDTREGILRGSAPAGNLIAASGVMNYIELDVKNLALWLSANQAGLNINNNTTGFTVYFSDRRGEKLDPVTNTRTGSYGYNDVVNPTNAANGCPNVGIDQGEDLEGDGVLRTYGGTESSPAPVPPLSATSYVLPGLWNAAGYMNNTVLKGNTNCGSNPNRPDVGYVNTYDARMNPRYFSAGR